MGVTDNLGISKQVTHWDRTNPYYELLSVGTKPVVVKMGQGDPSGPVDVYNGSALVGVRYPNGAVMLFQEQVPVVVSRDSSTHALSERRAYRRC
jgi:hypothetical protein